jgi:hypothetical protein
MLKRLWTREQLRRRELKGRDRGPDFAAGCWALGAGPKGAGLWPLISGHVVRGKPATLDPTGTLCGRAFRVNGCAPCVAAFADKIPKSGRPRALHLGLVSVSLVPQWASSPRLLSAPKKSAKTAFRCLVRVDLRAHGLVGRVLRRECEAGCRRQMHARVGWSQRLGEARPDGNGWDDLGQEDEAGPPCVASPAGAWPLTAPST